ncbi:hypothetical protein GWC77_28460 [Paraburkholderia sp. NMBU_R16]|nr:hypothetical protein [Paraburkholderia sp. NMBU_R16]
MPHKHNAARRHDIPKMAHRVTNWPEYEAGLRKPSRAGLRPRKAPELSSVFTPMRPLTDKAAR